MPQPFPKTRIVTCLQDSFWGCLYLTEIEPNYEDPEHQSHLLRGESLFQCSGISPNDSDVTIKGCGTIQWIPQESRRGPTGMTILASKVLYCPPGSTGMLPT